MAFNVVAIGLASGWIWILFGLLALWVASRGWHWFIKIIALIISVLPMLPIEAPDLLLMLLVCQATVLLSVTIFQTAVATRWPSFSLWQRSSETSERDRHGFTWGVSDLLLGTVVVAVGVVLFSLDLTGQNITLSQILIAGVSIGAAIATGAGLALNAAKWYWRLLVGIVIAILIIAADILFSGQDPVRFIVNPATYGFKQLIGDGRYYSLAAGGVTCLSLMVIRWFFSVDVSSHNKDHFWSTPQKILKAVSCFVLVATFCIGTLATGFTYCRLLFPPVDRIDFPIVSDDQNGFRDIVAVGRKMGESQILNQTLNLTPGPTTREELLRFSESFDQVERGLSKETNTWLPTVGIDGFDLTPVNDDMMASRSVARALSVAARQYRHDKKYDTALQAGLTCTRLSKPHTQNGVIISVLIAYALEGIGMSDIQASCKNASKLALKNALVEIKGRDLSWPSPETCIQNDNSLFWYRSKWKFRLALLLMESNFQNSRSQMESADTRASVSRQLLITTLALELHQREHGPYPESLESLVPDYLDAIEPDQYSPDGQPLVYCKLASGDDYQLYSVGPDQTDGGGELNEDGYWDEQDGDINLAKLVRFNEAEFMQTAKPDPNGRN